MYASHPQVNLVARLLQQYGVQRAVVCPGSRNAPLTNDLLLTLDTVSVTDERSAAFIALGLIQGSGQPAAVCYTSGSALLNGAPAVAEAAEMHLPLIVVTADRPASFIDRLEGQTIHQPEALAALVRRTVNLPTLHKGNTDYKDQLHLCTTLIHAALIAATADGGGPVHINVPIDTPLYEFTTEHLPDITAIAYHSNTTFLSPYAPLPDPAPDAAASLFLQQLAAARKPLVVFGTMNHACDPTPLFAQLAEKGYAVMAEPYAGCAGNHMESTLAFARQVETEATLLPDFVVYCGESQVSVSLKTLLRRAYHAQVWHLRPDGQVRDVLLHITAILKVQPLPLLARALPSAHPEYAQMWQQHRQRAIRFTQQWQPRHSGMLAVKTLAQLASRYCPDAVFCFGNSLEARMGNIYCPTAAYCNRGVNGIEGSVSAAAGVSLATNRTVICVVGDLSFFYDINALWNTQLMSNLRVLLINNGKGAIFHKFFNADTPLPLQRAVMGDNMATGAHLENVYFAHHEAVGEADDLCEAITRMLTADCQKPYILEVDTDSETDYNEYMRYFTDLRNAARDD